MAFVAVGENRLPEDLFHQGMQWEYREVDMFDYNLMGKLLHRTVTITSVSERNDSLVIQTTEAIKGTYGKFDGWSGTQIGSTIIDSIDTVWQQTSIVTPDRVHISSTDSLTFTMNFGMLNTTNQPIRTKVVLYGMLPQIYGYRTCLYSKQLDDTMYYYSDERSFFSGAVYQEWMGLIAFSLPYSGANSYNHDFELILFNNTAPNIRSVLSTLDSLRTPVVRNNVLPSTVSKVMQCPFFYDLAGRKYNSSRMKQPSQRIVVHAVNRRAAVGIYLKM